MTALRKAGKSGIRSGKRAATLVRKRDEILLEYLRTIRDETRRESFPEWEEFDPLSVYSIPPFPLLYQTPRIPKDDIFKCSIPNVWMPRWKEISVWMKVHLFVMWCEEFPDNFHTFNVKVHPDLESRWTKKGCDIGKLIRDRIRKEIDKVGGKGRPFVFVLEGLGKEHRHPVPLHIHGGAIILDPEEAHRINEAVGRAAGQGLKSYKRTAKAVHGASYTRPGTKWANYIQKFVQAKDERSLGRRVYMSQPAIRAAKELWEIATGQQMLGTKYVRGLAQSKSSVKAEV